MTNFMVGLSEMVSSIVTSGMLELVEASVICVFYVKVVQVVYKIVKGNVTKEDACQTCGIIGGVAVAKLLPTMLNAIQLLIGV